MVSLRSTCSSSVNRFIFDLSSVLSICHWDHLPSAPNCPCGLPTRLDSGNSCNGVPSPATEFRTYWWRLGGLFGGALENPCTSEELGLLHKASWHTKPPARRGSPPCRADCPYVSSSACTPPGGCTHAGCLGFVHQKSCLANSARRASERRLWGLLPRTPTRAIAGHLASTTSKASLGRMRCLPLACRRRRQHLQHHLH